MCGYWCCPGKLSWHFAVLVSVFLVTQLIEKELFSCHLHSGQLCTLETIREMVLSLDKERIYNIPRNNISWNYGCLMFAANKQFAEKALLHFEKQYLETFQDLEISKWPVRYWSKITVSRDISSDIFCIFILKKIRLFLKLSKIYFIFISDYWKNQWMNSWMLPGLYQKLIIHLHRCSCLK